MKKGAAALILALIAFLPLEAEGRVDIQVSYSRWTLSPFLTMLEKESKDLIEQEISRILKDTAPVAFTLIPVSAVDLSSSGSSFNVAGWYNLGDSRRFGLGILARYFDFRMPYSLKTEQAIQILDYDLAKLGLQADGDLRLRSVALSLLGRWAVLHGRRARLHLYGGLTVMGFEGDLFLDQETTLETPLGTVRYAGAYDLTVEEIRSWNVDIPSLILSPSLGMSFEFKLADPLGLFLDVSGAQGVYAGAGLTISL